MLSQLSTGRDFSPRLKHLIAFHIFKLLATAITQAVMRPYFLRFLLCPAKTRDNWCVAHGLEFVRSCLEDTIMIEPLAIPIAEAARLSGVGRSTLYNEISNGNLEAHKVGRRTIVTMENLRSWLASRESFHSGVVANEPKRD
jgi:excisionase family DNA binding protein